MAKKRAALDKKPPDRKPNAFPWLDGRWPYLLLALAVFLVYANAFGGDFLLDDITLITRNDFLKSWHFLGDIFITPTRAGSAHPDTLYRPLQILLYFLIYQAAGLSRLAFHALNIGLHAANACLVYALGRRLGFRPGAVFAAALIWAVHPMNCEAVAFISGTADVAYTFFTLLGLVLLVPDVAPRGLRLACGAFALALLSKESAIVFPALAVCCLLLLRNRPAGAQSTPEAPPRPAGYGATWPLWIVAAIYLVARLTLFNFGVEGLYPQHDIYSEHMLYRFYTCLATIPSYLGLILWPHALLMAHKFPVNIHIGDPPVLLGIACILAAMLQLASSWRARRGIALGWGALWFGIAYAPNTGILLPLNARFFEHWMYLPSIGLALGTSETLLSLIERRGQGWLRRCGLAAFAVAVCALAVCTVRQNRVWHDQIAFYRNIIDHGDIWPFAHNGLGSAYSQLGEQDKAIAEYRKAIAMQDLAPEPHYNIAFILLGLPDGTLRIPEAKAELDRAIAIDPDYPPAYDLLANIAAYQGDKALESYDRTRAASLRAGLTHLGPPDGAAQPSAQSPPAIR